MCLVFLAASRSESHTLQSPSIVHTEWISPNSEYINTEWAVNRDRNSHMELRFFRSNRAKLGLGLLGWRKYLKIRSNLKCARSRKVSKWILRSLSTFSTAAALNLLSVQFFSPRLICAPVFLRIVRLAPLLLRLLSFSPAWDSFSPTTTDLACTHQSLTDATRRNLRRLREAKLFDFD